MDHNFDFNKLFYEGLYFVSREDQLVLKKGKKVTSIKDDFRNNSVAQDKDF